MWGRGLDDQEGLPRGRNLALWGVARCLKVGPRPPELGASGAEPETRGRGVHGRAGIGVGRGKRRAVRRTRQDSELVAAGGAERASERGRAMGQRAVGSLLLGLLLHARLLAVSVRDPGPRAGGARQLGGDTGGCSAGTLARDGRAREGPWAGTGQRHPAAWGFPRGRPRDPAWRSGAVPASVEIGGSPATLFRLKVASGHGPACSSGVWGS